MTRQDEMSNEDFRSLVMRAQWAEDHAGTEELVRYLLGIIEPKARRFPDRSSYDDVVERLLDAGLRAARVTVVKHIERPRNYAVRAIGFAYISLCRERTRSLRHLSSTPLDEVERADAGSAHGYDHVDITDLIARFRAQQTREVGIRIADVLELGYHLGCSDLDACRLLNFDATQTETVVRTKRRWRETAGSPLQHLADQLLDSPCPEVDREPDTRRSSD